MTFDELWRQDLDERNLIESCENRQEANVFEISDANDFDIDHPDDAAVKRFIEWLEQSLR